MKHLYTIFTIFIITFSNAQVNLVITAPENASAVRVTGPFWGWDPAGGPEASDNGDGTWTVTLDPAPGVDMEWLIVVDGVQESLVDNAAGGQCPSLVGAGNLITNYFNYANRKWLLTDGDGTFYATYDSCDASSSSDSELDITFTIAGSPSSVKMHSSLYGWELNSAVAATDNGDGTWTASIGTPSSSFQYLIAVDGTPEDLTDNVSNSECTSFVSDGYLVSGTDNGTAYANRVWSPADGDTSITFDDCTVITTFSNDIDSIAFSLYPNPASDFINISTIEVVNKVRVFDMTGRLVKDFSPNKSNLSLDISDLNKGVYLVQINSGNKQGVAKIIK